MEYGGCMWVAVAACEDDRTFEEEVIIVVAEIPPEDGDNVG